MAENDQQQQNEIRREDQEKNFSDQVMKTNCFISHSQAKVINFEISATVILILRFIDQFYEHLLISQLQNKTCETNIN